MMLLSLCYCIVHLNCWVNVLSFFPLPLPPPLLPSPPSRPDLWFSIRVLKGLKVTDIPIVKSFVHSLIMSIFQSCESCYMACAQHVLITCTACVDYWSTVHYVHVLKLIIGFGCKNISDLPFLYNFLLSLSLSLIHIVLVDPGRLEIDLMSSGPKSTADTQSSSEIYYYYLLLLLLLNYFFITGRARGVLTVTFTGNPPQKSSKYEGKTNADHHYRIFKIIPFKLDRTGLELNSHSQLHYF